jgi:transketolase
VNPADKEESSLDWLCINTIRTLSMDAVQAANSGHPGTPMAMAPVAYWLWQQFLRFDPEDPIWPNRDRFVLSIATRPCCSIRCCTCAASRR